MYFDKPLESNDLPRGSKSYVIITIICIQVCEKKPISTNTVSRYTSQCIPPCSKITHTKTFSFENGAHQ